MGYMCPPLCLFCHNCLIPQCGPDYRCFFHRIFKSWGPGIYFCHTLPRRMFYPKELGAQSIFFDECAQHNHAGSKQLFRVPSCKIVDNVHTQQRWLDIGGPSMKNFRFASWRRCILWILLLVSSLSIHPMFVSMFPFLRSP